MKSDSRLIEKEAEKQSQNIEDNFDNSKSEMVTKFKIEDSKVKAKNLHDVWITLSNIDKLKELEITNNTIDGREIVFSDQVQTELKKLQTKVERIYDSDIGMYELSYKINGDGSSELYIPLETKYTDDLTIRKIYNENDEFVAKNLESDIDFPFHKIETKKLYIQNIPRTYSNTVSVYSKHKETYKQIVNRNYDGGYDGVKEDLMKSTVSTLLIYGSLGLIYYLFGTGITVFLFLFGNMLYLIPIIPPSILLISLFTLTYSYILYKIRNQYRTKNEFDINLEDYK